jgi:hypothetical protein
MGNPMLVGAATIFTVRDLAASVVHYRDVLGFTVTFQYGEPAFYACLCRDEVAIHLRVGTRWTPGNGAIAVFVKDVDALHGELIARGAKVLNHPRTMPMACAISTLPILMAINSPLAWKRSPR